MKRSLNDTKVKNYVTYAEKNLTIKVEMFEKWKTITISQENIKSATHIISNLRYAIPGEVSIIMCTGPITIFISLLSFWPKSLIKSNFNCIEENTRKHTFFCFNG